LSGEQIQRSTPSQWHPAETADDIGDRIDRADFMEVNRLHRNVVNLGLGVAEQIERPERS
jgi:hypothetical protein